MPADLPSPTLKRGRSSGFTLAELLVVVTLTALLAALVLAALGKAKGFADSTACTSHLHQIGVAFQAYASDHDGNLPAIDHWGATGGAAGEMVMWYTEIMPYLGLKDYGRNPAWSCPAIRRKVPPTTIPDYALNRDVSIQNGSGWSMGIRMAAIHIPSQKVVLFCTARRRSSLMLSWIQGYGPGVGWGDLVDPSKGDAGLSNFCQIHNGRAHVLFADSHVDAVAFPTINDPKYWTYSK